VVNFLDWPGWHAYINGSEVEIEIDPAGEGDVRLRVPLPAGGGNVRFVFQPVSSGIWAGLCILSIFILALTIASHNFRRRSERP
jgi:hypothetical protein